MEERQVTVEGVTYPTPRPFIVLATQNPVELEGTFPLPEAQLDRFMMRVNVGYPSREQEEQIILSQGHGHPLQGLQPAVSPDTVLAISASVGDVRVSPDIRRYVTDLVRATRDHDHIELGVSPRGSLALYRGAQAYALIRGRSFVTPDDVKYLAPFILAHRVIPSPDARLRGRSAESLIAEVTGRIPVPVEAV
jgi:MoxR-like ATPase